MEGGEAMTAISMSEFQARSREEWVAAIARTVGEVPPVSAEWDDLLDMERVLRPFLAGGISHAHLPYRGTLQFESATISAVDDCLDLRLDEKSIVVLKPAKLRLEYVAAAPAESFILIECARLPPVLDGGHSEIEEVCDLGGGDYIPRHHWDTHTYEAHGDEEADEAGERPLPESAKLVRRILSGTILLVCKGSRWNRSNRTGTGEHMGLDPRRIREIIASLGGRTSVP